MMDWAGNIESRNYGIRRQTDRRHLSDLLQITASVLLLAGVFGAYAWVRTRTVDLGYAEENLRIQEAAQQRVQKNLILEETILKNPERIDTIAQGELGMIRLRTNQLLSPAFQKPDLGGSSTLAMASVPPTNPEPRKTSATY